MTPEIKACIQEIADANGGKITPDEVITHARNAESPLHHLFNWNVEQAAWEAWRQRARDLIASVRVEVNTSKTVVQSVAYVRDPSVEPQEQGYISVTVLRNDADLAAKAFLYEFGRAESALNRATDVAAALQLKPEVERLTRRVSSLREKVNQQYVR